MAKDLYTHGLIESVVAPLLAALEARLIALIEKSKPEVK
jgi:hypothetical protein